MRPDMVFGHRILVASLAELGRLDEAHHHADRIMERFQSDVTAFLSQRWPEWEPENYARYVASLAKGGLVMRDGGLTRVNN